MDNQKKISAAVSAVMAYIKTEEELIAQSAAMSAAAPCIQKAPEVPAALKLWGISGRQTMMQMRNMMQMKAFK